MSFNCKTYGNATVRKRIRLLQSVILQRLSGYKMKRDVLQCKRRRFTRRKAAFYDARNGLLQAKDRDGKK